MFKQDIEWRSGKYTCKVALNTFIRLNVNHKKVPGRPVPDVLCRLSVPGQNVLAWDRKAFQY